ncbi:GATA zinc finger domain-containing protein 7 [Drosophila virilis]|uniref:Uncharacterized protein n=1 Tax=Drosophila virilis TaxID=7244 RepID=B4LC89_DROVI|nr:putative uncharacterized protein DDB_G0286901 [Drosophila virilis]EDW68734.1 uncharacterized protein Dvir_GJ12873 [Drosophila virilis]
MQKQRSPYTGGGFNLQQLKATTFSKNESLNGMPFLVQLAHQVQVQQRPMGNHLASALLGTKNAGLERGMRSGTPRSYLSQNQNSGYNGSYEGDMPPLCLGQTNNNNNPPLADDCLHMGGYADNMDNMDINNNNNNNNMNNVGHMGHMDSMDSMDNMGHMGHMDNMGHLDNMSHMGHMGHMDNSMSSMSLNSNNNMNSLSGINSLGGGMNNNNNNNNNNMVGVHLGHLGQPEAMLSGVSSSNNNNNKAYQSDTDSETEYCKHMQNFDAVAATQTSRWRRVFDYLKSGMPPQRQERMEAALQRCCENTFFNHVLLVLQLLSILIGGVVMQSLRLGLNLTQLSFRLWRCKFQLRSILRQLLWRMANAKGNDALLFLGVMLISPWLFLISLVGFAIAFMFHFKEGLGATLRQVRLQMLN